MAHIRAILRAKATHFSGQLQAQTMTILNDNFMYMESRARQIKRALEHTFPYIVATGLSKVIDSFKRTQFITYTAKVTATQSPLKDSILTSQAKISQSPPWRSWTHC